MRSSVKKYLLAACLLWLALASFGCLTGIDHEQDFQAGMEAYQKGDYETALKLWRPIAESGHPSAQTNLGVMYYQGLGTEQDYAQAVKWYQMAALQGYADAEFNLAVAYADGRGLEKDYREALRWYRLAAEQGYAPAAFNLGDLYYHGRGVGVDYDQAARWYRQAADQGHLGAIFMLGSMHVAGQGVPRDLVQAYMWFTLASLPNNAASRQSALRNRDLIARQMTPDQIDEAEQLAKDWKPKPQPGKTQ